MTKLFIFLFFAWSFYACSEQQKMQDDAFVIEAAESDESDAVTETEVDDEPQEPQLASPPRLSGKYTIKAYLTDSLGWGYTILEGTKVVVNQPHIPAVQGLKGFTSEARATRAGEEVAFKLEQGIVPPTLTVAELKALKVID